MYKPTTISSKNFKTIPFDKCQEIYSDAATMALETAESSLDYMYKQQVQEMEKLWADAHESPYEGNFAETVPRPELSIAKKQEIRKKAGNKAIQEIFIVRYKVKESWTWMMPQMMAYIASLTPQITPNTDMTIEGQIDGLEYIKKYFFHGDLWSEGLYRFLMLDARGSYIPQQYKGEGRNYCGLIPLIMYAHKLHNGIPYSAWKRDTVRYVVNDELAQAMVCDLPQLTKEEILAIRDQGLYTKTGAKAGETRDPLTQHKLYAIQDTELGHLPEKAQVMITQIWCAHPENRTKYMILDPKQWDAVPSPLIAPTIFKTRESVTHATSTPQRDLMPWEL